jgi:dolichol-phosphate mannosyltransferase
MTALTVIVPVYNEGENLREWWAQARDHLPPGTIVRVVYDFEEDNTLPVLRDLVREGAPMEALRNQEKGVIGALKTGLRSVQTGAAVVSMADLSDDISILPRMLAEFENGASVVVASRYMAGGRQEGGPLLKGQLSRWGGVTLHHLAGFPVHDATNSFRLYAASLLREIELESAGGFEIGFEITYKAWRLGHKVVELPCVWRDRVRGESRFNLRKWLPRYARWWASALAFGVQSRVGLNRRPARSA